MNDGGDRCDEIDEKLADCPVDKLMLLEQRDHFYSDGQ